MTKEQKHTPTPWMANYISGRISTVANEDGTVVVPCGPSLEQDRINAAYIVKCVNAHEKLVEVLKLVMALPELNPSNYDHEDACELNSRAVEAALAAIAALASLESK